MACQLLPLTLHCIIMIMPVRLQQKSFSSERQIYDYDILDASGKMVGMAQLRLKGSKSLGMPDGFDSHIYYEVDPKERGKGYATAALKKLLKIAENNGLKTIIATVNSDNEASKTVVERCGGDLIAKGQTAGGQEVLKYELDTSAMNDLYDVGPAKPMGYLPKSTIIELEEQDIAAVIKELESKGLKCFIIEEEAGGNIASGALVAYDEQALSKLLRENLEILKTNQWPQDAREFAERTCKELAHDEDLYRLVAYAYADKRPEFHRSV